MLYLCSVHDHALAMLENEQDITWQVIITHIVIINFQKQDKDESYSLFTTKNVNYRN